MAKQPSRLSLKRIQHRQRRSGTPTISIEQSKHTAAHAQRKKHKTKEQRKRRGLMLAARAQRARRERWAAIAVETQGIVLGDGKYVEESAVPFVSLAVTQPSTGQAAPAAPVTRIYHDIVAPIILSRQRTVFYPHYSPILAKWNESHPTSPYPNTQVVFARRQTLNVARELALARSQDPLRSNDVGILSFASAKRPGGGYLHGSSEQEDTIARLSSLVASLTAPAAKGFYKEHHDFRHQDGSGLQDHSMLYSPGVVVFRKDADDEASSSSDSVGGAFISPYTVNVVSVVPVNAAEVRKKHVILPGQELYEVGIRDVMKERMARSLRAFEANGDKVIILGAFGCSSSENKVDMIASIWAELLVCGDTVGDVSKEARYKHSFEKVMFAVPGKLFEPFKRAFDMRILEQQLTEATLN